MVTSPHPHLDGGGSGVGVFRHQATLTPQSHGPILREALVSTQSASAGGPQSSWFTATRLDPKAQGSDEGGIPWDCPNPCCLP